MSTTLPTQKTKQPSRAGLLFHEILADGLIHAAAVFGIEQDERFVERVANLAWSNGVNTVKAMCNVPPRLPSFSARGSKPVAARPKCQVLCKAAGDTVEVQEGVNEAIRGHYETSIGTRALDARNPAHAGAIRQLVGEAVVAGLSCRGLNPKLYQAVLAVNARTRLEQQFLCELRLGWAQGTGLPTCHPFLQMAERFS
jgi:hypothetical protein